PQLADELRQAFDDTRAMTMLPGEALVTVDVNAARIQVNPLLTRASEAARATVPGPRADRRGADLAGADLAGADLRGASLRGAYRRGANPRGADRRRADIPGADVRGADLSGANLTDALFLTQSQLEAATGDGRTKLSPPLQRPAHWAETVSD